MPSMRLTDFIDTSRIRAPLTATSKEEVIRELLDALPLPDETARQETLDAVLERERLMTTGIGHGIAIPHGVGPVVEDVTAALGIAAQPLDFDAIDDRPVRLVFLVIANPATQGASMRALARLSRLLHNEGFRKTLCGCESPAEALAAIEAEEARHRV